MPNFWPKSLKARRRLMVFLIAAPVFAAATGLALYALKDGVVYFYTPAQAIEAKVPAHKAIRLGGLVETGSLQRLSNGAVEFVVVDKVDHLRVHYQGDLPDLFREGQGVVMEGALDPAGKFVATSVLAKHDENYMPKEVTKALKEQGEWRPETAKGDHLYTPTQLVEAKLPANKTIRLKGIVLSNSVIYHIGGEMTFEMHDNHTSLAIRAMANDLPNPLRESQSVVIEGGLDATGTFVTTKAKGGGA